MKSNNADPRLFFFYAASLLQLREHISNSPGVSTSVVMPLNLIKPSLLFLFMDITQTLITISRLNLVFLPFIQLVVFPNVLSSC